MLNKISIISFLFTLSFLSEAKAQLTVTPSDTLSLISLPVIQIDTTYPDLQSMILNGENSSNLNSPKSIMSINKDHVYNTHFGFFCKQEAKRDKKSNVPVRMRLGTLDQVNHKEYGN